VDSGAQLEEGRSSGAGARVRVSRGQLRDDPHPERRPRGGEGQGGRVEPPPPPAPLDPPDSPDPQCPALAGPPKTPREVAGARNWELEAGSWKLLYCARNRRTG